MHGDAAPHGSVSPAATSKHNSAAVRILYALDASDDALEGSSHYFAGLVDHDVDELDGKCKLRRVARESYAAIR